jgi:enolase-phosphatase E1
LNRSLPSSACILLDVEGTTTSISFVHDILFPYARQYAGEFLLQHGDLAAVKDLLVDLRRQHGDDEQSGILPPPLPDTTEDKTHEAALDYLCWLMDRDSKATDFKALQGLIWEEGYRDGRLKSHVYPDVPQALKRWHRQSRMVAIFSSGSVLAQKLLFANTEAGDLSSYIDAYFDTETGTKRNISSYEAIARNLKLRPGNFTYVSDVGEELDAASAAGMTAVLCIRPGNPSQVSAAQYATIHSFDELD